MTNKLENNALNLNCSHLKIKLGELVKQGTAVYKISELLDFGSIIGVCVETGRSSVLRINELQPLKEKPDLPALTQESNEIADEDWATAQNRLAAIRPLLNRSLLTQKKSKTKQTRRTFTPLPYIAG